jgi:hypothetical protein
MGEGEPYAPTAPEEPEKLLLQTLFIPVFLLHHHRRRLTGTYVTPPSLPPAGMDRTGHVRRVWGGEARLYTSLLGNTTASSKG